MTLNFNLFFLQECFKSNWSTHKIIHSTTTNISGYNPWPNYRFTGILRPAIVTPTRIVPEKIARPDYALHPEGISYEERAARKIIEPKVNWFY